MYEAIKLIYPDIQDSEFEIRDDGNGAFISAWSYHQPSPDTVQLTIAQRTIELDEQKDEALEQLNDLLESALKAGFYSNATGTNYLYGGSLENQIDLIGAVTYADARNTSVYYTVKDNQTNLLRELHTKSQIKTVFLDGVDRKQLLLEQYNTFKQQIIHAGTPEDVQAIQDQISFS